MSIRHIWIHYLCTFVKCPNLLFCLFWKSEIAGYSAIWLARGSLDWICINMDPSIFWFFIFLSLYGMRCTNYNLVIYIKIRTWSLERAQVAGTWRAKQGNFPFLLCMIFKEEIRLILLLVGNGQWFITA